MPRLINVQNEEVEGEMLRYMLRPVMPRLSEMLADLNLTDFVGGAEMARGDGNHRGRDLFAGRRNYRYRSGCRGTVIEVQL
jgi:hypothetical protein